MVVLFNCYTDLMEGEISLSHQLETFFYPKHVVLLGASKTQGKIGHAILKNIVENFKGKISPVNPKYDSIMGLTCYSSVSKVPGDVDLAVIALPSKIVPKIVEECGEAGIKNIVLISGGFKELGGKFKDLSKKTARIAQKYDIRMIGPNCIGVMNPTNGFLTFFQPREKFVKPEKGNVAILSQSGTNGLSLLEWFAEDYVGISKFVSYGNKLDVNEADLLRYLRNDRETEVIGIYLEALQEGRRFYEEARKTTQEKPLVVLRGGGSEIAAEAALSHTGFLGGKKRVYKAAFKQSGILEAENMESLFDIVKTLSKQPFPAGSKIAFVSNGAGPMVQAVDCIETTSMTLAEFSGRVKRYFEREFPPYYVIKNPLDLTGSATVRDYEISLNGLTSDENVDIIALFFVFQDAPLDSEQAVKILKKTNPQTKKPILVCAAGGSHTKRVKKEIEGIGIPTFPTAERLIKGAEALSSFAQGNDEVL